MGVDVVLYAEGEVSDEELAKANDFVRERTRGFWDCWSSNKNDDMETPLVRWGAAYGDVRDAERIDFQTLMRYYGPGYERGNWPLIRSAIVALRAALPGCDVYYGGDTGDGELVTDETIAALDAWWLSPKGLAYRFG